MTYLGPSGSQIGHKESIKDTARVLGRMYDGIQYRGHGQEVVETLAQYAGVPVWNGLTNEFHPTQLLADLLTMKEHLPGKAFNQMTLVYAGDARNNMGNSMLEAAALTGLDLRLVAPSACWPEAALVETCTALAKQQGGNITLTEDIAAGVKGADFIYTDVWVSMGEAKENGPNVSPCCATIRLTARCWRSPATRRSSSSTACRRSTTTRPRWANRWLPITACTAAWR